MAHFHGLTFADYCTYYHTDLLLFSWIRIRYNLSGEIDPDIVSLGFKIETEIKLLGFALSNCKNIVELNYAAIKEKIVRIVHFWDRFFLSLPGKITVYKTLLLPQLNYIASILTPTENMLNEISKIMENFVTQGLNIAKNPLYS